MHNAYTWYLVQRTSLCWRYGCRAIPTHLSGCNTSESQLTLDNRVYRQTGTGIPCFHEAAKTKIHTFAAYTTVRNGVRRPDCLNSSSWQLLVDLSRGFW